GGGGLGVKRRRSDRAEDQRDEEAGGTKTMPRKHDARSEFKLGRPLYVCGTGASSFDGGRIGDLARGAPALAATGRDHAADAFDQAPPGVGADHLLGFEDGDPALLEDLLTGPGELAPGRRGIDPGDRAVLAAILAGQLENLGRQAGLFLHFPE